MNEFYKSAIIDLIDMSLIYISVLIIHPIININISQLIPMTLQVGLMSLDIL